MCCAFSSRFGSGEEKGPHGAYHIPTPTDVRLGWSVICDFRRFGNIVIYCCSKEHRRESFPTTYPCEGELDTGAATMLSAPPSALIARNFVAFGRSRGVASGSCASSTCVCEHQPEANKSPQVWRRQKTCGFSGFNHSVGLPHTLRCATGTLTKP